MFKWLAWAAFAVLVFSIRAMHRDRPLFVGSTDIAMKHGLHTIVSPRHAVVWSDGRQAGAEAYIPLPKPPSHYFGEDR